MSNVICRCTTTSSLAIVLDFSGKFLYQLIDAECANWVYFDKEHI
jgi:hypothetical protein